MVAEPASTVPSGEPIPVETTQTVPRAVVPETTGTAPRAVMPETTGTAVPAMAPATTGAPVMAPETTGTAGVPVMAPVAGTAVRRRSATVTRVVPSAGLAVIGVLVMLVGAWAGIVPFVGALFNYSADGTSAWYWDLAHALLWLAPGAIAFVMGLAMVAQSPRIDARLGAMWAGLITVICGGWLVIGSLAWPVIESSGRVFVPASPLTELTYQVGWSLGPGLVLVLLGGAAMGLAMRRRNAQALTPAALP